MPRWETSGVFFYAIYDPGFDVADRGGRANVVLDDTGATIEIHNSQCYAMARNDWRASMDTGSRWLANYMDGRNR